MLSQLRVLPPWLDNETSALVRDKIEMLASRHPALLAIILYGSVARHEERPVDDPDPSDVDLLAIFEGDNPDVTYEQGLALSYSMGLAEDRHLQAPREVNVMFTSLCAQEWDPDFIANVKRDGIILYQRGPLPSHFAA